MQARCKYVLHIRAKSTILDLILVCYNIILRMNDKNKQKAYQVVLMSIIILDVFLDG